MHVVQATDTEPTDAEIVTEIEALKTNPTKELLTSMSISLRSRPIRWVSRFTELHGITYLLDYLKNMNEKTKYRRAHGRCA